MTAIDAGIIGSGVYLTANTNPFARLLFLFLGFIFENVAKIAIEIGQVRIIMNTVKFHVAPKLPISILLTKWARTIF